ncbi:IS3 family transposase [Corynebacterium guangdongense]|uniref:IS3 family transposase n=1 Tax=Corynebacterium guangdongense TaxID=1783348 RepID=UPI00338ECEAA
MDDNRAQVGVEPIIRVLATTSAKIALSTYYAHKSRPESARSLRDRKITRALRRIFDDNYSCYGARKLWAEINREGACGHVARCTVERLMAADGLVGIRRRQKRPSTRSADAEQCPVDLVDRDFCVTAPDMLWVADITYSQVLLSGVFAFR